MYVCACVFVRVCLISGTFEYLVYRSFRLCTCFVCLSMLCDFLLSVFCERSAQASEASDAREAIQTHAHSQRFWPCLGFSLCVRPSFFVLRAFCMCATMRMSC